MKSVAVLALAAGASAQVSLYTNIAKSINAQIGSLDAAIKAYTSGDGKAVISEASALLSVVNSGSAAAKGGDAITDLPNALLLLPPYTSVVASVKQVVGDLVSKKSLAAANGLGGTAYALLNSESAAALALAAVITGQLQGDASDARGIASNSVIVPLTAAINSGISAFAEYSGKTGGSGTTSTGDDTSSDSSSTTETTTTTESEPAATSSVPPTFTGNAAAGLKVGSGAAALLGALAYVL